jgi:hypothetical protein
MADFIPKRDGDFDTWQKIFVAYIVSNASQWGFTPAEITALTGLQVKWDLAFTQCAIKQAEAESATQDKSLKYDSFVTTIRNMVKRIQTHPSTTDAQRSAMNITVKDTEPTPVGAPAEAPLIYVDFANRLQHVVHWGPNPMDERRNAKPRGVASVELRIKIDSPPTGPEDMEFVAIDTGSPYVANMQGKAGKTVYWLARYLNTKGEPGPWGETVSADVTG